MPKLSFCALAVLSLTALAAPMTAPAQTRAPAFATPDKPWLTLQALRSKYVEPGGRFATIGGVEIYYKDEGPRTAPVLLMIHGSVSSLHTWDGVAAKLKDRYRIIRYDIPPQGLSGPVSDEAAAKLKPTDIPIGLLDQLGVKRATVVGVSSGGTMGMFLAAERPDLVERLILSNTPSDPVTTSQLQESDEFKAAQAEANLTGFQSMRFWNDFMDYFSGDPKRITPRLREQYYDLNRRLPEKHPIALVAVVADHAKAVAAMAAVKAPTLLIWGSADPLLGKAADVLGKYLTATQVSKVYMPDVGHYPPLEAPDRFAQVLAAYIEAAAPLPEKAR